MNVPNVANKAKFIKFPSNSVGKVGLSATTQGYQLPAGVSAISKLKPGQSFSFYMSIMNCRKDSHVTTCVSQHQQVSKTY